jgi:4-hydroxy-2-oxoheptanedioate aldolase
MISTVRINTAFEKMRSGKPAFGYALGLGSPLAAEALANTGPDFILLDGQHGSFGLAGDTISYTFMAIASTKAVPMARVARNDYTLLGKLLDEGALGIVVPMIHTAADAKSAADACRLPPRGTRSWGWGRASAYGLDYPDWIDEQIFVAVQIESAQAVDNAEAILATPGVNGCWMGPSDLALSMGIHPRDMFNDQRHAGMIERVLQACRNTGKIAGFACSSPEQATAFAARGWQFLTAGSDVSFMLEGARRGIKTLGLG